MDFTLQTSSVARIMSAEQEICVLQLCMRSTVETLIGQIQNQYYNLQATSYTIHANYGYNTSGTYKYSTGTIV